MSLSTGLSWMRMQADAEVCKWPKPADDHQLDQFAETGGAPLCSAPDLLNVERGKRLMVRGKFWSG